MRAACRIVASFIVLGFLSHAAQAAEQNILGNAGPDELKTLQSYQPFAEQLGAGKIIKAMVSKDKSTMRAEFIPVNETISDWSRIVSVTIAAYKDSKAIDDAVSNMRTIIKEDGTQEAFEVMNTAHNRPAAYFCYSMGKDAKAEHTCGIIGEYTRLAVTSFQLMSHDPLTEGDKDSIKNILQVNF